jgi:hypothetical protein|eukprot:COSAG03_NODE_1_length_29615_cov_14.578263_1_plen_54_part_00
MSSAVVAGRLSRESVLEHPTKCGTDIAAAVAVAAALPASRHCSRVLHDAAVMR